MANKISSDEKRWQAESDARTMAEYQEIMNDSARRNAAIKTARKQASDMQKRANAMASVAKTKTGKK